MTESEFLDRQEARAREELTVSARRIEAAICGSVPLERIIREHPVLSLGAGAAGGVATGFLLGKLLGPRAGGALLGALRALAWPTVRRFRNAAVDAMVASAGTAETTETTPTGD